MTKTIQNLIYSDLGTSDGNRIAGVKVETAIDTLWVINLKGNAANTDEAANVNPKWVLVDNIGNNGFVTVTMGSFTIQIPSFQRESIAIPSGTTNVQIQAFVGNVTVTVSEARLADNQSNNLLIQQTAVKTLIYGFRKFFTSTNQTVDDLNHSTEFAQLAGAFCEYKLMNIASGLVGDGWFQYINNTGNVDLYVNAFSPIVVNNASQWYPGKFTGLSGTGVRILPGESGYLRSDGAQWYLDLVTRETSEVSQIWNITSAAQNVAQRYGLGDYSEIRLTWAVTFSTDGQLYFALETGNSGVFPVSNLTEFTSLYTFRSAALQTLSAPSDTPTFSLTSICRAGEVVSGEMTIRNIDKVQRSIITGTSIYRRSADNVLERLDIVGTHNLAAPVTGIQIVGRTGGGGAANFTGRLELDGTRK